MSEREAQWSRWMAAAQQGDCSAYRALLTDIKQPITAFVRKRCLDPLLVDDIVQEVLLAIHRARHTYDPQYAFAPWMFAITRNRFIDSYRKLKRRSAREVVSQDVVDLAGAAPEAPAEGLSEAMSAALGVLNDKQRTVVELLKIQELTVKEIAQRLDMGESAVKVTAHRAYKKMRKYLEDVHED